MSLRDEVVLIAEGGGGFDAAAPRKATAQSATVAVSYLRNAAAAMQ